MTIEATTNKNPKEGAPVNIFGAQYLGKGRYAAPALCGDFRAGAVEAVKPKEKIKTDKE